MMRKSSGFTIIEVLLFLAVSAALIMGIMLSASKSVDQQRYEDSVQNFSEFLRTIYSEVSNPRGKDSGTGGGRSNYAMYGKLVTFGEAAEHNPENRIFVYDVVGATNEDDEQGTTIELLKLLNADVIERKNDVTKVIAKSSDYSVNWDARVEKPDHNKFVGALLIVRSPVSGTIFTYSLTGSTVEVQAAIANGSTGVLKPKLDSFSTDSVSFCVAAEGFSVYNGKRYNIRIANTAHDSSGVEVVSLDAEDNHCK